MLRYVCCVAARESAVAKPDHRQTKDSAEWCYNWSPDELLHLTRSGRRNSVFFYGVSPSNPLAFEAAARVRQG